MKKGGKYLVITATLVPEADDVENSKLEEYIRGEVEKVTIPWVRGVLKVTILPFPRVKMFVKKH